MTKTVFPTFQINAVDQQAVVKDWDMPNTEIFQSKDVASVMVHVGNASL
jgi:hypothetical protein